MILKNGCSAPDIETVGEAVKEAQPNLAPIISLYEKIFVLQEQELHTLDQVPVVLSEDLVQTRREHGFPLLAKEEFSIDAASAQKLFKAICRICSDNNIEALDSVEKTVKLLETGQTTFDAMTRLCLESSGQDRLERFANDHGIDTETLEFLVYNSIKPSIAACARQVAAFLDEDDTEKQGFCPVCGENPAISMLGENGERSFACSFCWHQWQTERIFCPFCNTKENKHLSYLLVEDEKGIRGDVCEKCGKYVKTIDTREYSRNIYLPLELLGALPLDMKLAEEGFSN
ncbi:MAG: formate dehydrogenase accessory protein FdhE [Desulfobacteraceae bacterium]